MTLHLPRGALQVGSVKEEAEDEWGWHSASGVHCPGRIVLNLWRLMKSGARAGGPSWGGRAGGRAGRLLALCAVQASAASLPLTSVCKPLF